MLQKYWHFCLRIVDNNCFSAPTLVSQIEGGGNRRGVYTGQFSMKRVCLIQGDMHVSNFLIERGARRRWFMLVNCFLEGNSIFCVLIMIDV